MNAVLQGCIDSFNHFLSDLTFSNDDILNAMNKLDTSKILNSNTILTDCMEDGVWFLTYCHQCWHKSIYILTLLN